MAEHVGSTEAAPPETSQEAFPQQEAFYTDGSEEALDGRRMAGSSVEGADQAAQAGEPARKERIKQGLDWLLQWPFILHAALVLALVWIMSLLGMNYPLVYVISFIFLFHVESRHSIRLQRRIRHEEKKHANRKQLLSDYETVRWLNEALEKAWPVFLEKFASQEFLGPLLPFFLAKYKPSIVQDAVLQNFCLGRTPPMFTGLRAVDQSATDDNLVFEAAMEFVAADDMSAVLSVQLKKRLTGLWTKIHISNMHIEGKVRLGVKFIGGWPFVSRLRISFESAPYVQITARPLTNFGMDVAELPGIATWLDTMLADALADSIVKPNMLVINMEKIASSWVSSGLATLPTAGSPPVAVVLVEILEATQLKPADVNGLADPFVKGAHNTNRFKTSIKWKTLNPKWREEFRLPVKSWDVQNRLVLHVRDKDFFRDDNLGFCEIPLSKFRDGNRHEMCLPLKGVKTGRLNLAITVEETSQSGENRREGTTNEEDIDGSGVKLNSEMDESRVDSLGSDHYEIIDTGVSAAGIFSILRPGKAVQKRWRSRKGRKVDDSIDILPLNTLFSGSLELDSSDSEDEKSDKPGRRRFWKWSHKGTKDRRPVSGELITVAEDGTQMKLRTVIDSNASELDKSGSISKLPSAASTDVNTLTTEERTPATNFPNVPTDASAIDPYPAPAPTNELVSEPASPYVEKEAATPKLEDESPPRDDVPEEEDVSEISPGRRSMKERAKGVMKHAERTASHIGHTLWRKRSNSKLTHGEGEEEGLGSPRIKSECSASIKSERLSPETSTPPST